jgi:hypothetical protein
VDGLPGPEKDLLGQVFGVMLIAYAIIDVSIYPVDMHVIQPPKGLSIVTDSSLNQGGLVRRLSFTTVLVHSFTSSHE